MYSKKLTDLFFVIGFTILTILGCGEDTEEPLPPPTDDLFSKEDLVGSWNVVSVNDIELSRFIVLLLFKDLNENIGEEEIVPAAPDGEIVFIEDEPEEIYYVKTDVHEFYYTFDTDDLWTLHVKFNVLPNDEVPPIEPGEGVNPGGGMPEDPIDPNIPASPAANGTNEVLGMIEGNWSGTYQVESNVLTLTIETEDVKVTPIKDLLGEIPNTTEADRQAEMIDKFRVGFFNPFTKTFVSIDADGDGKLTLKMPGSSGGKMILEKR